MSGLLGSSTTTADTPLAGIAIQSSANGIPIPLVYGTTRVTPNLLWYGDFSAIPHTTTQRSGGKGGGQTSSNTSYTYSASFVLGICEGPVGAIPTAWIDKAQVSPDSLFSLFLGTYPQGPWSYLTSLHPGEDLGYQGVAYAAAGVYDLGAGSGLPNHSFEVQGKYLLQSPAGLDADPADIITDLLTNASTGVPNAPTLGRVDIYSGYCRAAGLLLSPCYSEQTSASQIISDLMQLTNTGIYYSEGVLKLVPYGDTAITGHGAVFTPSLTPVANFGDDDFLAEAGNAPVVVKRNAIAQTTNTNADACNQVTVEFVNRANSYQVETVIVQDQAAIDVYGLRPMETITAHQIADAAVAQAVALLILQRSVYVRSQYEFKLGWQWCALEPTDLVTITDSALGLSLYPVRIISVEEDEAGTLTLLAEDAPPGVGSHVTANVPVNGGYNSNQAQAPGDTNTPVVFEAPNALTSPDLQLWVGASGGANWGGCNVWASSDASTYKLVGTITGPARYGLLTSILAAGSDPDTTHTLAVDLTVSQGQLLAGSSADADAGNTMLWVDGELISYSAATLTGAYHYSLGTYLRRGQKGTTNASHLIGAQFARLDDAIFKFSVSTDRIGSPIYLKFPSFNIWGESTQSLSDVTAYTHTFAGNKPSPLASLSAVGGMFEVVLSWAFTAGQIDRDFIEVWGATTNNRASAFLLSSVKNPATTFTHSGLTPAQTWYYWARVVDTSGNDSDFYPAGATAGVAASPSADASALLAQLNNSLGLAQLTADLAAPIASMPGALRNNAAATIQSALSDFDLTNRMQWQEQVTNATVTVDPITGKIALLATANVTTDVSSRLTAVEVLANATNATLTSTVATLTTVQGNLTSTQSAVSILQGQITSTATTVYVNNAVANATGAITTTSANAYTNLAAAELQSALDAFTTGQATNALTANVATAQSSIKTTADALSAMSTSFAALVATYAGNAATTAAAIVTEQTTRANADTAIASTVTTLTATVAGNLATTNASLATKATIAYVDAATATLNASIASTSSTLTTAYTSGDTATLGSANTHSDAAAATAYTNAQSYVQSYSYSKSTVDSAIASSSSSLTTAYQAADTATLAAAATATTASITSYAYSKSAVDGAISSAVTTLMASGPTGYAAVVSSASASASAITGLQANYTLKVDTSGHVAGMTLASGGSSSAVVFLADKFAFVAPDGSGTPKYVMTVGNIGGVSTFGLDGNMVIDGTIVARSLSVTTLSAITANLGTITAGRAQNASNTNFVDFSATGSSIFMQIGSNVSIDAAGNATFNGVVLSRNMLVATGFVGAGASIDGYSAIVDTGVAVAAWASTETYVCVVSPNSGVSGSYTSFSGTYPEIRSTGKLIHTWRWSGASTVKIQIDCAVDWAPGWTSYTFGAGGIRWNLYKVT